MRQMIDLVVAVQKSGRVYNRMMKETARQCGITKPAMDVLLFLHNNPEDNKASDGSAGSTCAAVDTPGKGERYH
mgnify:CR=1 FL=1